MKSKRHYRFKLSMAFEKINLIFASLLILFTASLALLSSMQSAQAATILGVYNGPGKVTAADNFSSWLGTPVTYATDYIDYKGGWQKDFIDSKLWLTIPWGKWVSAAPNRRLVLGLPMLQNSNYGQFDQGAAGSFDYYFKQLGNDMVANKLGNSIIRLGYEANCDTIGPWQATDNPSGYVRHFRHIVAVMRSVPGSSFKFDWTVCNGLQSGNVLDSFEDFYPGNDVVDIIGMDQYDVKWNDTSVSHEQRWNYNVTRYMGLQDHRNFATAKGKPVSFPEWGLYKPGDAFAGGGDNPYFIHKMADWFISTNAVYQSYFNLNWGGGVLADFPNGQAAYKQRFGGTTTTPPPPTTTTDTTAPNVNITYPLANATVSGKFAITVSASDNVGVTKIEFYIDGTLRATDTSPAYSYTWASTKSANGNHIITAKAYDAKGNSKTVSITVNVYNISK